MQVSAKLLSSSGYSYVTFKLQNHQERVPGPSIPSFLPQSHRRSARSISLRCDETPRTDSTFPVGSGQFKETTAISRPSFRATRFSHSVDHHSCRSLIDILFILAMQGKRDKLVTIPPARGTRNTEDAVPVTDCIVHCLQEQMQSLGMCSHGSNGSMYGPHPIETEDGSTGANHY